MTSPRTYCSSVPSWAKVCLVAYVSRSIVDSTNPMPSPSLPATSSIGMIALDGWGQAGGTSGRTKKQGSPVANLYVYCFDQQAVLAMVCLYVRTYIQKRFGGTRASFIARYNIMPFCRVLFLWSSRPACSSTYIWKEGSMQCHYSLLCHL